MSSVLFNSFHLTVKIAFVSNTSVHTK